MQTALAIGNGMAVTALAVFIVLYLRVRWEKSPEGKSIMALAVSMLALAATGLLRRFGYDGLAEIVLVISWPVYTAVMIWRTVRMWKLSHAPKEGQDELQR